MPRKRKPKTDKFGNREGTMYDVVRFYQDGSPKRHILEHVDDKMAHKHVNDPKTSGTTRSGKRFFDGFVKHGYYRAKGRWRV
tara:strand:+ start:399 stop:644 length:246 start_codon:yes stop_codon:yes gene_type:complete